MNNTHRVISHDHFDEIECESRPSSYQWPVYQPLFSKRIYKQLLSYRSMRKIALNEIEHVIGSIYNQSKEITMCVVLECEVYSDNRLNFADIKSFEFLDEPISASASVGSDVVKVMKHYSGRGVFYLVAHVNGYFWVKKSVEKVIDRECKIVTLTKRVD